jgi:hypothetical protein
VPPLQPKVVCFEAAGRGWREVWQGILGLVGGKDSLRADANKRGYDEHEQR